jgi:hypothetical protein
MGAAATLGGAGSLIPVEDRYRHRHRLLLSVARRGIENGTDEGGRK